MAKKKVTEDIDIDGGISSVLAMVKAVDDSAEIIEESSYSNIQEWVPSGNYILNACMSGDLFKAVPSGRIVTLCGPSGCLPADEEIEVYIMETNMGVVHHNIWDESIEDIINPGNKTYCINVLDLKKEICTVNNIINPEYYDLSKVENDFNDLCKKYAKKIKIIDLFKKYRNDAVYVNTPDGFQLIGDFVQKNTRNLYEIKTENHSVKCSEDHLIETIDGWVHAKYITENMQVLTSSGIEKVIYTNQYGRDRVYDFEVLHVNHRYYAGTGISSHNTGKSFLACSMCREAQKMGYTPIYMDSEGAIDSTFVKRLGVDPSKMIIKQVQTIFETSQFIANICKQLQAQQDKTGRHDKVMFVLDSLGNLTSEKERDDTMTGNQKADFTKAKDTKALFRVNATPIAKLQCIFVVCNHVYSNMSFIPSFVQANGSGIVYNASITLELSAAKLDDKDNEKAAAAKQGSEQGTKNGVLVTVKPVKSRFCRPLKIKMQIPFYKKPNPYVGLEAFMNWENSGVVRGNLLTEKEYMKLSDNEKKKVQIFDYNGETKYAMPKETARGIIVKHLGESVPLLEFYTPRVFTQEFLEELNENVIHPIFDLPDQSAFDDIKEIEESLGISEETNEETSAIIDAAPAVENPITEI